MRIKLLQRLLAFGGQFVLAADVVDGLLRQLAVAALLALVHLLPHAFEVDESLLGGTGDSTNGLDHDAVDTVRSGSTV